MNWIERLLAILGAPAGASISADIAALKTALDALGLQYVEGSVSDAGPAAADFDTDLAEATDNHYNGMLLMFADGVCAGQAHVIDDYDGTAKNVAFSAEDIWTEAPGNGDNFIILPSTGTMAKAIYARLGAPAGASVAADIAALKTALDALGLQYVEGSVSDAGPAAADFDTDLTEATDDHYNGMLLMFADGVCAGQAHVIDDYDGTAKNVAFSAEDIWTEAPGDGDNFILLPGTGGMAKAIYTRLGAPAGASIAADLVTIAAYLDTEVQAIIDDLANATDGLGALKAIMDTSGVLVNARTAAFEKLVGVLQIKATTIDLQQAAASYDLFTGTTQDVMLEKLVIRLPNVDVSDDATLTSISIQTDDVTAQVIIDATAGDVSNLTAEAQLAWTGAILIKTGTKIQLTIAGGAADDPTVCDVVAECRAVVSGGYLA